MYEISLKNAIKAFETLRSVGHSVWLIPKFHFPEVINLLVSSYFRFSPNHGFKKSACFLLVYHKSVSVEMACQQQGVGVVLCHSLFTLLPFNMTH